MKTRDLKIGRLFPVWARELYGGSRNETNALRIADELVDMIGQATLISKVDRACVKEVIHKCKLKGNKSNTINRKLACLSKLLNYAIDEEVLTYKPVIPFFKPAVGRIRALSREEEQALRSHLPPEYANLFDFLLYTGCRYGEAINLTWQDVHADHSVTFWCTKSDTHRTVPLADRALAALNACKGRDTPFGWIEYSKFKLAWDVAKVLAGLGRDRQVTPHVLRHTCATRLGKARIDPLRMQQWLGHRNLSMTKLYTHLDVEDLSYAKDALEG